MRYEESNRELSDAISRARSDIHKLTQKTGLDVVGSSHNLARRRGYVSR